MLAPTLGNGSPQPSGLRDDTVFDTRSADLAAECFEHNVIANQPAGWCGNPFFFALQSVFAWGQGDGSLVPWQKASLVTLSPTRKGE